MNVLDGTLVLKDRKNQIYFRISLKYKFSIEYTLLLKPKLEILPEHTGKVVDAVNNPNGAKFKWNEVTIHEPLSGVV